MFRVWGFMNCGFRVSGFRAFKVWGLGFEGLGFRVWGSRLRRVWRMGFRVQGSRREISHVPAHRLNFWSGKLAKP